MASRMTCTMPDFERQFETLARSVARRAVKRRNRPDRDSSNQITGAPPLVNRMTSPSAPPSSRRWLSAYVTGPDSFRALLRRRQAGTLDWRGPAAMLFARPIFAVASQALVAGIFALQSSPTPWRDSEPWLPVY